ncbi:MAG TPA: class I adenylate-forming enzyme family protein [Polyangia bacterium]|nr:class I adenylate-forming enzyme family protein [Polyangia bacterium]
MLLPDLLTEAARRFPDKDAAVFPGGEAISFAALDRASRQVAAGLRGLGVRPGQRVAILYENSLAALTTFWGVLRAGAASVDIPSLSGPATIAGILEEARPAALAVHPRQLAKLGEVGLRAAPEILLSTADAVAAHGQAQASAGRRLVALEELLAGETPDADGPEVTSSDVALVIYTSGTTGRPKGVMLTHDNLQANVRAFNSRIQLTADDSLLVVVPLHFIHGRIQLLTFAMLGATLFFSGGFHFPKVVLDELVRHGVTVLSGVPYHFATLMAQTKLKSTPLPRLRHISITGGALSPAALRELQDAVPNARIHINYGQTESSPRLTYLGPTEVFERVGSCGRALPGVTLEILDEDARPLPAGEVGEVVATSPGIMRGYVSGDERTSGRIDAQGRLWTGDLGRLDADGFLYLAGRRSAMIKHAGERIFPGEVEEVLDLCPGVAESAVLGVPDPVLGERLVACVVLKPGAGPSAGDIRQHCLKSLPLVRTPREVRFVVTLPKTASGKVMRAELPQLFSSAAAAPAPAAEPSA